MLNLTRTKPGETELRDYAELGFCVARDILTPEAVIKLQTEAERFIQHESSKLTGRDINFSDASKKNVNSIHRLHEDPFFNEVLHKSDFKTYASSFLQEGAVGRACEMFAKPAGTGLPSPTHQDNAYWCIKPANALTFWIALNHADYTNGGVFYVEGSHKLGLIPHVPSNAPGSSQTIRDLSKLVGMNATCIALKPGDIFIHHVHTVHWSGPNETSRPRRGITMQYVGESTGIDLEQKRAYEQSLAEQIRKRETQGG